MQTVTIEILGCDDNTAFTFTDKRRRDIDNNLKLCLDAMNNVVYHDDTQVHRIEAEKRYGKEAGTEITILPM